MSVWGFLKDTAVAAVTMSNPLAGIVLNSAVNNYKPAPKTTATGNLRPVARPKPQSQFGAFASQAGQGVLSYYKDKKANSAVDSAANAVLRGGQLDRDQRNLELSMQDPSYIRQQFEAAGFNPLLGIGNALKGLSYGPSMGQNMANYASIKADGFHKSQLLDIQRTELDMENRRLNAQIKNMTLNPKVGGVYSRNRSTLGGSNADKTPPPFTDIQVLDAVTTPKPVNDFTVPAPEYETGQVVVNGFAIGDKGKSVWHNWGTAGGRSVWLPFEELEWDTILGGSVLAAGTATHDISQDFLDYQKDYTRKKYNAPKRYPISQKPLRQNYGTSSRASGF